MMRLNSYRFWAGLLMLILLSACQSDLQRIEGCDSTSVITAFCGFKSPEDLAVTSDGEQLIVSEMADMHGRQAGSLALFDLQSEVVTRFPLFAASSLKKPMQTPRWGDASCKEHPGDAFSPHGIDLIQREDGRWQLLVVNHGGRESIEFFELETVDGSYQLNWRGCVLAENDAFFNDVAGLKNGGFVVSNMFDKHSPEVMGLQLGMWQALAGFNVGSVIEWLPGQGFRTIPGSEAPFVNGVAVSVDEDFVYANIYAASEVRKIHRQSGRLLATARIPNPDNITKDKQGRLLVASHQASTADMQFCFELARTEVCPFGFALVRLDSESFQTETVFQHQGAPMGAATVAVENQGFLYVGSFQGDRIIRVPYQH